MNYCLALVATLLVGTACAQELTGRTFLRPRSLTRNMPLEAVGLERYAQRSDDCQLHCAVWTAPVYGNSFRPERIAQYFFGNDYLVIKGSQTDSRPPAALLADNFGLSPRFDSTVHIKPQLQRTYFDAGAYLSYGPFYATVHVPYGRMRTTFKFQEVIANSGAGDLYPPGYMGPNAVAAPFESFVQAIAAGAVYGDVREPLLFGKIAGPLHKTHVSDIELSLGWNFVAHDWGYFGVNIRGAIPTSERPCVDHLFVPLVGSGHNGQVGVGLAGAGIFWEKDGDQELWFTGKVNAMHLFKTCQTRSFDFITRDRCNLCIHNFFSRYMLLKEYSNGVFNGNIIPAINRTTLPVDVHVNLELELLLMFTYSYRFVTIDAGYNGWVRSRELITLRSPFTPNTFALKGIANAVGQASQPNATIFGDRLINQALVTNAGPVFLSTADLDIQSSSNPRTVTHTLFSSITFYLPVAECHPVEPFIAFGGAIEFEGTCHLHEGLKPEKNSLSQWSMWAKVGIGF